MESGEFPMNVNARAFRESTLRVSDDDDDYAETEPMISAVNIPKMMTLMDANVKDYSGCIDLS